MNTSVNPIFIKECKHIDLFKQIRYFRAEFNKKNIYL